MLSEYLPILLLAGLSIAFAGGSLAGRARWSARRPRTRPSSPPTSRATCRRRTIRGSRFSVKFYMVAMLFLIFDVEAVFLYPWAVVFRSLGWFGLAQMGVFLAILGVAFVYEIGRGGLEWD